MTTEAYRPASERWARRPGKTSDDKLELEHVARAYRLLWPDGRGDMTLTQIRRASENRQRLPGSVIGGNL